MRPTVQPIHIGPVAIETPVILAPMTGVSDLPFRRMVRRFGSGLNVTEMIASQAAIRETRQSLQKLMWDAIEEPVSMQLVGCTPYEMGEAAKLAEDKGAGAVVGGDLEEHLVQRERGRARVRAVAVCVRGRARAQAAAAVRGCGDVVVRVRWDEVGMDRREAGVSVWVVRL